MNDCRTSELPIASAKSGHEGLGLFDDIKLRQVARGADKRPQETGRNLLTLDSLGKMIPPSLRTDLFHAQACGPRAVLRLISKR